MFELKPNFNKKSEDIFGLESIYFSKEILNTNYSYLKEFFEELGKEYKNQAEENFTKIIDLSPGLENLSMACIIISGEINENYGGLKKTIYNINSKELSEYFANTNYYYQSDCFKNMKNNMPPAFDLVLLSMDEVLTAYNGD
jgi:hypothetical protein